MLFKGLKSLIDSITGIIKEGREQYVKQQNEMDKKVASKLVNEAKSHTVPKTDKEKRLAALAEPKDKITHKDVMVGRGVKMKEEVEQIDEIGDTARGQRALKSYYKKGVEDLTKTQDAQSYASQRARQTPQMGQRLGDHPQDKAATALAKQASKRMAGLDRAAKRIKEATDTPGNGREHQCAIHVKSEQFGEGKTLTTQHAEPDRYGNIAWYDVMFEHGIERVDTENLEILVSESHMNHKKKKGM